MKNAVNRLGIVPIRSKSSDTSEMISQMLYGERCYINDQYGLWSYIVTEFDGYKGWVDTGQLTITDTQNQPQHVVSAPFIQWNGQYLPMGSELSDSEANKLKPQENQLQRVKIRLTPQQIAQHANKFLRSPYLWGGRTVFGVDCSGLTQTLYKVGGYQIPRDSGDQEKCGSAVTLKDSLSGDLAFFTGPGKDKISHVGIILQEHDAMHIIHASSYVKKEKMTPDGIISADGSLTHNLVSVKRIIDAPDGSQ